MKSSTSMRALSPLLFAAVVGSLLHCGGGGPKESFTSEGDAQVMSDIVGTWTGMSAEGRTYTMTLCESSDPSPNDYFGCETLHTVKGGGRGKTETVSEPGGCGGCDYDYSAFVSGTLQGDDLASKAIVGQFALASGDADGLGFPYEVRIVDSNGTNSISMLGVMESPGLIDNVRLSYPSIGATRDAGDPWFDAGVYEDASAESDADTDASDLDASLDASEADAEVAPIRDASFVAPPSSDAVITGLVFHRVDDATCPTP